MKSKQPLIGITTAGQHETKQFCLKREYVEAVRLAGGIPILQHFRLLRGTVTAISKPVSQMLWIH